jgi:hypothetical protein
MLQTDLLLQSMEVIVVIYTKTNVRVPAAAPKRFVVPPNIFVLFDELLLLLFGRKLVVKSNKISQKNLLAKMLILRNSANSIRAFYGLRRSFCVGNL